MSDEDLYFDHTADDVTLAEINVALKVLGAVRDNYLHEGETFPDSVEGVEGMLMAYRTSRPWIRTGIGDDAREVRLTLEELCACSAAGKFERAQNWTFETMEQLKEDEIVVRFTRDDS